jgi:hypothetical protein
MKVGVLAGVVSLLVLSMFMVPGVMAAGDVPTIGGIVESIGRALRDIFSPILSTLLNYEQGGANFGARILAGLVLFFILYVVIGKVPTFNENRLIIFVLSLVPTLLIMRSMTDEQFQALLFPTTALGTILALAVPILGVFVALHYVNAIPAIRRIVLFIVMIVYIVYAASAWSTMPADLQTIYVIAFLLLVSLLIFDSTIHQWFALSELSLFKRASSNREINDLESQLIKVNKQYNELGKSYKSIFGAGGSGWAAWRHDVKEIEKRIKEFSKS